DPRAGLPASLGDGLPLQGSHARGCFRHPRLARHRVRGGGPMKIRSELRLTDSDIAGARQRLAVREADKSDVAITYVPSQITMILFFGSPIVWAWIWGVSLSAVLAFSAWQSLQTPNMWTEFVEWTIAFLISLGPLMLGLTAGFLAAAPLVERGYVFFGV